MNVLGDVGGAEESSLLRLGRLILRVDAQWGRMCVPVRLGKLRTFYMLRPADPP
jgi:hypothetical protein